MSVGIKREVIDIAHAIPVLPVDLKARRATLIALALIRTVHPVGLFLGVVAVIACKPMGSTKVGKLANVGILVARERQACEFADTAGRGIVTVGPMPALCPFVAAVSALLLVFFTQIYIFDT
jgi:hypothetical protein